MKGIYSFGLMETNFYDQAEKLAKEVSGSLSRCKAHLGVAPHIWTKQACLPILEILTLREEQVLGQVAPSLALL